MNALARPCPKPRRPRASDEVTGLQLVTLLTQMPLEPGITPYLGEHWNQYHQLLLALGWNCPQLGVAIRLTFGEEQWTAIRSKESYAWEDVQLRLVAGITHSSDERDRSRAAGLFVGFCDCGTEFECPKLAVPREMLATVRSGLHEFRKALLMRDWDKIAPANMVAVDTSPLLMLPPPGARPVELAFGFPDVELPC